MGKILKGDDGIREFELGRKCMDIGDYNKARNYFYLSAEAGNPQAQYELAICYEEEGKSNLQKNYKVAEYWLKQAATQGYIKAQNRLSDYYTKDKVQQN